MLNQFNYSYLSKALCEKIREICENGFTNYTEKASLIIELVKQEESSNIYLTVNVFDEKNCRDLVNTYKALDENRLVFKTLTPINKC